MANKSAASSARIISVDTAGNVQSIEHVESRTTRSRLGQLAWLLDSSIPVPGTRLTVGLDAVLGLFPLLGDLIGVLISTYIVNEAARLGAPRLVLLRMALNVGVEGIIGVVPFVGDLFDAAWKANQRNVRLLDDWLAQPTETVRTSRYVGFALILALAVLLVLLGVAGFFVARWLIGLF